MTKTISNANEVWIAQDTYSYTGTESIIAVSSDEDKAKIAIADYILNSDEESFMITLVRKVVI